MSGDLEQPPMMHTRAKRAPRRPRWFPVTLGAMVVLFVAAMVGRNHMRAHWWAYRLAGAEDLSAQSYYLGALAAVGPSARGAVERLAESDAPHLRAMAVIVLKSSSQTWSVQTLDRLLNDTDVDVRESAALALGFMRTDPARSALRRAVETDGGAAAAAVYALGRTGGATAMDLICEALASHASPSVRAQAVETLADMIRMEEEERPQSDTRDAGTCDPWLALTGMLADHGEFDGLLAIEREIEGAMAFASVGRPLGSASASISPAEGPRTVSQIATKQLSALSGEVIAPVAELSADRQAELADRCRRAFLALVETADDPLAPRDAEKPASTPAGSSDTHQDRRE